MKSLLARVETVSVLMVAWILVFVLPFRWGRRLFGSVGAPADQDASIGEADLKRARMLARRLNRIADRLPWTSTCLVRALAGRMLLAHRGLHGGRVRFGVRREGDGLAAHAWLILGPVVLLGDNVEEDYKPLADLSR